MGRTPCCSTDGVKKGAWTSDEDEKLIAYIQKHGEGGWRTLPHKAGLQRCGKSCRLRWTNYLRPDIKRGEFSGEEEQKIIELHAKLGNRWSAIAKQLVKRTDNEIKNYWNTHLKKRLSHNILPISPTTLLSPPPDTVAVPPRSASAMLLNRLATRFPSSCRLDFLKDGHLSIQSPATQSHRKDVVSISDASSGDSDFMPGASSARFLLNKMARHVNTPSFCLEMVKSILSKSSNTGIDGEGLVNKSKNNGQTLVGPTSSASMEAAENLPSNVTAEDVPSVGGAENDEDGGGSMESLTKDLDLDFLQDWKMVDNDDIGVIRRGGGSYEDGVSSSCVDGEGRNIESPMPPLVFVDNFDLPESGLSCELSTLMGYY